MGIQIGSLDFPVFKWFLAALIHVSGGAHEVVPFRKVDIHRPASLDWLLDGKEGILMCYLSPFRRIFYLDGELEWDLHDGVNHALMQLCHVRDCANILRLKGACEEKIDHSKKLDQDRPQGNLKCYGVAEGSKKILLG